MSEAPESIMSHVSVGTNQYQQAIAFYEKTLASLGAVKIMEHPGACAFGRKHPEFWVQKPYDGKSANVGNGTHFAFFANSKEEVEGFYFAAIEAGATDDGKPGPREEYGKPYYGCFVRDLDGNKIEAAYWDTKLAAELGMGA